MKSYVVIGCGRFGSSVAKGLFDLGNEVLAIDISEETINELSDHVTFAAQADIMDETVLKNLGLSNFDVAVIGIGSDLEASVMATLVAKELGVKKVIAKAQSGLHSKILKKIGADKVVYPEQDMGLKLAHNLAATNILDYIELSPEYSILELKAIKGWVGKTLADLSISSKYGLNVIAIKKDKKIRVSPLGSDIINADDTLVMIGNIDDIEKIEKQLGAID